MARWIRWTTRLSIYYRDRFKCVWCRATDQGLSLDHVVTRSEGGRNHPRNLVTSCKPCNDSRGAKTLGQWLVYLDGEDINIDAVATRLARSLNRRVSPKRGRKLCRTRFGRLV